MNRNGLCAGLLIVAVLSSGCGTNQFVQELRTEESSIKLTKETLAGKYPLISTNELKKMVDAGQALLLVDAMPASASFDKGHIAGAINLEFPKEIMTGWDDQVMGCSLSDYEKRLGKDKNRKIVVYCGFVKCARSHNAAIFAKQLGYTNVFRYPGGIHAWRGAGFPLTTD